MNRLYLQASRRLITAATSTKRRYTSFPIVSRVLLPSIAVSSTTEIGHQHKHNHTIFTQQRYMASKKKGKKGSGGGNSNKPIKYQPVFHPEDVDDVDDNDIVDYVEEAKDFDQLVRDTEDYGFERDNLEMLDDNLNWIKLTSKNLKEYKGKVVKIRDKEMFGNEDEEEYDPEDGYEDEDYSAFDPYDYKDKDMIGMGGGEDKDEKKYKTEDKSLRLQIEHLVADMKYNGYERQDTSTLRKASTGESISTKEYVLSKAAEDEELLTLLVEKIGALDHIVQWTHFDA